MGLRKRTNPNYKRTHSSHLIGGAVALGTVSSGWMVDELIVEPKELEFLAYEENAATEFQELVTGFSNENITSMDTARNLGVEREWQVNQFFAQDDMNAPGTVFQYINDDGEVAQFTEAEQALISEWDGGKYPIAGIEGHHMELVSHNPDDINLAANPDNIFLATGDGHALHLHGGYTKNATTESYFDDLLSMEEKFKMTIDYNEMEIIPGLVEQGAWVVGGSAAIYVSLSLVIEMHRLRKDPRPWIQKRGELIQTTIATSLLGVGLSAIGFVTKIGIEGLFVGFTPGMLDLFFTEMMAINGAIFVVVLTSSLVKYLWHVKSGQNKDEALEEFKLLMMVATSEFLAFSALGLGMDLLVDMAADSLLDALIPDPTGVLIAARVGWGLFKAGKKVINSNQNKTALKECVTIRMDHTYQLANRLHFFEG